MSVSVKITGLNEFKYHIREFSEKQKTRLKMALDSVLIDIVNYIKNSGQWIDRTSNLRNSVGYAAGESDVPTFKASKTTQSYNVLNLGGGSQWDGNILSGVVFAGMEYAIYVEFKEGHWVLSGGFNEFRPKVMELLRERAGF